MQAIFNHYYFKGISHVVSTKKEPYSDISILYILLFVCSNRLEQKILKSQMDANGRCLQ